MTEAFCQRAWVIAFLILLPAGARSADITVVVGVYRNIWDDTTHRERAETVADRLAVAAGFAGFNTRMAGHCPDLACAERAVSEADTTLGAFAEVEASDASYDVTITLFPERGGEKFTTSGTFADVLDEIEQRATALFRFAMSEIVADETKETGTERSSFAGESGDASPVAAFAPPDTAIEANHPPSSSRRRPVEPAQLWTGVGITAALALGWGALEVIVHRRYKRLKQGKENLDYWQRSKTLQVASRAMFTATATAAATTFILLFFTDLQSDRHARRMITLAPRVFPDGGAVGIEGRF